MKELVLFLTLFTLSSIASAQNTPTKPPPYGGGGGGAYDSCQSDGGTIDCETDINNCGSIGNDCTTWFPYYASCNSGSCYGCLVPGTGCPYNESYLETRLKLPKLWKY